MTMDDPTTVLTRDSSIKCIMLAGSLKSAQDITRAYACSIQVSLTGEFGIRLVTTQVEAIAAAAALPGAKWCIVPDGLWESQAREALSRLLGPASTIADALDVHVDGKAWLPHMFQAVP